MYTSRQNYNVGSHPVVGIIMFLFVFAVIAITITTFILFFVENVGVFFILFGLFMLYMSYDKKTTWQSMMIREFVGISVGMNLIITGIIFIIFNDGITIEIIKGMFV